MFVIPKNTRLFTWTPKQTRREIAQKIHIYSVLANMLNCHILTRILAQDNLRPANVQDKLPGLQLPSLPIYSKNDTLACSNPAKLTPFQTRFGFNEVAQCGSQLRAPSFRPIHFVQSY